MTEQEAYAKGLEKLELWSGWDESRFPRDLRKDPAFAWRVQNALGNGPRHLTIRWLAVGLQWKITLERIPPIFKHQLNDALYAAVCRLGREEKP